MGPADVGPARGLADVGPARGRVKQGRYQAG